MKLVIKEIIKEGRTVYLVPAFVGEVKIYTGLSEAIYHGVKHLCDYTDDGTIDVSLELNLGMGSVPLGSIHKSRFMDVANSRNEVCERLKRLNKYINKRISRSGWLISGTFVLILIAVTFFVKEKWGLLVSIILGIIAGTFHSIYVSPLKELYHDIEELIWRLEEYGCKESYNKAIKMLNK